MSAVFWLLVGVFVGIDIGLAYNWSTLRRINQARHTRRTR